MAIERENSGQTIEAAMCRQGWVNLAEVVQGVCMQQHSLWDEPPTKPMLSLERLYTLLGHSQADECFRFESLDLEGLAVVVLFGI
jgi:hypothetical protein